MELKGENHSATPARAAIYPDGLAVSTGGLRGSIIVASPIERSPASLSTISTGSSSIWTCLGGDKQGKRWVDHNFCMVPVLSCTSATIPELFVYLMDL